jgi:hypothetical protein
MDTNTLVTFAIAGAVAFVWGYDRVKRLFRRETTSSSAETSASATEANPLPLALVLSHLNDRPDDVPHVFVIGSSGAGKSTFARLLLAQRVNRGETYILLTGKRSSVFADVPCIGRDPIGADGVLRFDTARAACTALLQEIARRDELPAEQRTFTTLNVVIDDASILLSELPEAAEVLRVVGLLGRELRIRLIVLTGSLLVKELGLEGRSDLREHFAVVSYQKQLDGSRVTTLRPRYDERHDVPFDARRVPELSKRVAIPPDAVWNALPLGDDTLLDSFGAGPSADDRPLSRHNAADGRTDGRTDSRDNLIRVLARQKATRETIREAVKAAGWSIGNDRLSELMREAEI